MAQLRPNGFPGLEHRLQPKGQSGVGHGPMQAGTSSPAPAGPGFHEAPLEAGGMAGDPHRAVPEGLQHSRQNLSTGMAGAKSLALGDAMGGQGSR